MDETLARVESAPGQAGASLYGELDLSSYEKVSEALAPLFDATGDVTLDLSGLTFIDSSGIRVFIRLRTALGDRGRLILRRPNAHLARVFAVSGFDQLGIVVEEVPA
jgi:anti-sigma B factor antagonist